MKMLVFIVIYISAMQIELNSIIGIFLSASHLNFGHVIQLHWFCTIKNKTKQQTNKTTVSVSVRYTGECLSFAFNAANEFWIYLFLYLLSPYIANIADILLYYFLLAYFLYSFISLKFLLISLMYFNFYVITTFWFINVSGTKSLTI